MTCQRTLSLLSTAERSPSQLDIAHDAYVRGESRRLLAKSSALSSLPSHELCNTRWLFYRGNENYGLGNVLYDVSSAAALALAFNRTLLYGINADDRKFGTLLTWPGIPTLADAEALQLAARCNGGSLSTQHRVLLAPDRCTFHRTWRRERTGHVRCLKRLLGVNWLADRTSLLELSKVHASTGLQTLLKSTHGPLRQRVAAITGGCLPDGVDRPNIHGALLATLMVPAPAVLHAVRWILAQQPIVAGQSPSIRTRGRVIMPPPLALHVRAMSDHRARNLSAAAQADQMLNALLCVQQALRLATAATSISPTSANDRAMPIFVASSSPELRVQLLRRIATHAKLASAANGVTAAAIGRGALPVLAPFVFDWQKYVLNAPRAVSGTLAASEGAADAFCSHVHKNERFRCNRSAHMRDWGPEPHWVAVVELLVVASVGRVVIGAGYPYFKVCNTFCQIGAALADAAPPWLCELLLPRLVAREPAVREACAQQSGPRGVHLICASRLFSTDWGSSMWRTLNSTKKYGQADAMVDCGGPKCIAAPLHPELWRDLRVGSGSCANGDTATAPFVVFGTPIRPLHAARFLGYPGT